MKKFVLILTVMIISLGFFGCGGGGGSNSILPGGGTLWWEGQYPIETYNGTKLPPGQWVNITIAGLTTSYGDIVPGIVSTLPGGDVLDGGTVIGQWVYVTGNGYKIGVAINVTNYTQTGQVFAVGGYGVDSLATDFFGAGLTYTGTVTGPFVDPEYNGIPFWLYSSRLK